MTLAGSHSLNHNIERALRVLEGLGDEVDRVVSHQLPLKDVAAILQRKPPQGSLKVHAAVD